MFLVDNECTKLTASWLNALGIALIAAGAFAPAAAWLYGLIQTGGWLGLPVAPRAWLFSRGLRLTCCREGFPRETARMTALEIYVLMTPLIVFAIGMAAVGFGIWQDRRRDAKRNSAAPAPRP